MQKFYDIIITSVRAEADVASFVYVYYLRRSRVNMFLDILIAPITWKVLIESSYAEYKARLPISG